MSRSLRELSQEVSTEIRNTAGHPQKRGDRTRSTTPRGIASDPTRTSDRRCGILALLWQILSGAGFPNQFFNDSWVVGFWRADHGRQDAGLERRAWTLAQAVSGSVGS